MSNTQIYIERPSTNETFDLTGAFICSEIARPFLMQNIEVSDKSYANGSILKSVDYPAANLTLILTYIDAEPIYRRQQLQRLAAFLRNDSSPREQLHLYISDDKETIGEGDLATYTQLYYKVIPSGAMIERYISADSFELSFLCIDPHAYSNELLEAKQSETEVSPWAVGSRETTVSTYKTYGSASGYPSFQVYAQAQNGQIGISASTFSGELAQGSMTFYFSDETAHTIEINSIDRKVHIDGELVKVLGIENEWFVFPPNQDVSIQVYGKNASVSGMMIQTRWMV